MRQWCISFKLHTNYCVMFLQIISTSDIQTHYQLKPDSPHYKTNEMLIKDNLDFFEVNSFVSISMLSFYCFKCKALWAAVGV